MKSIRTIALATLVAVASLAPALQAQTRSYAARVDIPFSFNYGDQHFSAGVYTIGMENPNVLALGTRGHTVMAIVRVSSSPTPMRNGVVIFHKVGDRYFLKEYRPYWSDTEITLPKSSTERRAAAAELASRGSEPAAEVALALLPPRILGN
jgi:hypothetical protein